MSTHEEIMEDFYGEIEHRCRIVGYPFEIIVADEVDRRESKDYRRRHSVFRIIGSKKRPGLKKKP